MARAPWESHDYDEPQWDPSQSGPEYHLNKNAPPRCTYCDMVLTWEMDDIGPVMVCQNRRCIYYRKGERP